MARFYPLYNIYNWNDDVPLPTTYTTIGGVQVRTSFSSTALGPDGVTIGFNYVRFLGLVPAAEAGSYERGFSSDDVGTTYLPYQSITIPDDAYIDPDYLIGGSGGDDSDAPTLEPDGSYRASWGDFSNAVSFGVGLSTPYKSVVEYAAWADIAGIVSTVSDVAEVNEKLTNFLSSTGALLERGIGDFENVSAQDYLAMQDSVFDETASQYQSLLASRLGAGSAAAELFGDVNVVVNDPFSSNPSVNLTLDWEVPGTGGLVVVGFEVGYLVGTDERDVFLVAPDTLNIGQEPRFFDLHGGKDVFVGTFNTEVVDAGSGNDDVYLDEGDDTAYGGDGQDTLNGGPGRDDLLGEQGNDRLIGGSGDDTLDGGAGKDRLEGGLGLDILDGGSGDDKAFGGAGNDDVYGAQGRDSLDGGAGRDYMLGEQGNDRVSGGSGNDSLGGGTGRDRLSGGTGRDLLDGGNGRDFLDGGRGADILFGNSGRDILVGRRGEDMFVFDSTYTSGRDLVRDFEVGVDSINLESFNLRNWTEFADGLKQTKRGALYEYDGDSVFLLNRVSVAEIERGDVIL